MADIKQIQVGGTNYNIAGAAIVLEDNGTTTAGTFLAKTNQISSLVDGQLFIYKLPKYAPVYSENTLKINSLSAKSLYNSDPYDGNLMTLQFESDTYIMFYYLASEDHFILLNTPSHNLYNMTKIYGKEYPSYNVTNEALIDLNGNGIDINSPNDRHYFAHIKNTSARFGGSNNNIEFYGTSTHHHGTKIYIDANDSFIEMRPRRTKIYVYSDYGASQYNYAQLYLLSDIDTSDGKGRNGLYVNRPIHMNANTASATDLTGVQMQYNSTDECLDFVFD